MTNNLKKKERERQTDTERGRERERKKAYTNLVYSSHVRFPIHACNLNDHGCIYNCHQTHNILK